MIIDARLANSSGPYRAYTQMQAVALALDGVAVGSHLDVEALIDPLGRNSEIHTLSMYVPKVSAGRKFSVRKADGLLARIHRIA